ncbi:hypothetical protein SAMN05421736_12154 [Evansella caseinilytica]|uniref:Uncharacterized protein n=1 Tax=Evansella caseinilytica TaxID=1503961 RepID=A0A1H3UGX5_9BACI|nr:hypothetical protein [Evansella caseinilytica]SDZ61634.1 hypothetical protein SAMN05421736_12154 [Evansella caseinilytica]
MKAKNNMVKVTTDMSLLQLSWSAWFLSFVLIAYAFFASTFFQRLGVGGDMEISREGFVLFAYNPAKIYMLVIGIISVSSFLKFYVQQGVTRKDYFFGATAAAVIVSVILMSVAGIATVVEGWIHSAAGSSTFLGEESSLIVIVIVCAVQILVYYIAGWLIGAGFYRYGVLVGMLYIALATAAVFVADILLEVEQKNPLEMLFRFTNISFQELPFYVSFVGAFLLLAVMLWIVRATTKRVPIKME